jgi:C4-dicarboxylate-specific signal transduction histidine kinase
MVRGDSKRLRQVMHNLLKNAIEALDGGEGATVGVYTHLPSDDETPSVESASRTTAAASPPN